LNKSVQTGKFYTQTLVTYDMSEDAKLTTTPCMPVLLLPRSKLLPLNCCMNTLPYVQPLQYLSRYGIRRHVSARRDKHPFRRAGTSKWVVGTTGTSCWCKNFCQIFASCQTFTCFNRIVRRAPGSWNSWPTDKGDDSGLYPSHALTTKQP